jgi:hypothetical protein
MKTVILVAVISYEPQLKGAGNIVALLITSISDVDQWSVSSFGCFTSAGPNVDAKRKATLLLRITNILLIDLFMTSPAVSLTFSSVYVTSTTEKKRGEDYRKTRKYKYFYSKYRAPWKL